ncbi:MAG: HAD-IA family hydrolase [Burkholderiales bacterium]|nr:MAG: HAD-IA family hydrolase [Burkholderiales bacterium]
MRETLQALIFDVDGTLAETEELHRQAFNVAFAIEGTRLHWDRRAYRARLAVAGGKERIAAALTEDANAGGGPSQPLVQRLHRRKTELYTGAVATGALTLRPGVARLVAEAAEAGLRLAIATTTTRANVEALLASVWPHGHPFEVLCCADTAPRKKPAPDVYFAALQALGVAAGRALALEDSANGVRAARAAGVAVLATPGYYTAGDDFEGAAAVLSSLGDPGSPATALGTPIPFARVVDLAWLRRLFERVRGADTGDARAQGVGARLCASDARAPAAERMCGRQTRGRTGCE